jgi:AraC family transcriptional activator of mtrCDE
MPRHGWAELRMDALSELVRLARLDAKLDLRCQFADGFSVDHEAAPPREIVFHVALSGRCVLEVDGMAPMMVEAGDFVALPAARAHCVRSANPIDNGHRLATFQDGLLPVRRSVEGEVELDLLCGRFTYDSSAVDTLFEALPRVLHVSLSDVTSTTELRQIIALIRSEVESGSCGSSVIVASLSTVLLTFAMRISSRRDGLPPGLLRLIGDQRLARATQAILGDPGRDWSLKQLAELSAMSRATFARRFTEAAAMSPGALLLTVRMSRAADLLVRTRRSVADIGAQVGYQSEAAFVRAFRRATSLSPSAFRKDGVEAALPVDLATTV